MKRVHLFIPNFRTVGKITTEILAFLVCVVLLEKILEYFVYDDTMEEARAVMYDFYHQDKIDNLFLGSSHVYFDINPAMLNEYTGKINFNLSTPFQSIIASYYLLREADKKYNIENVYLEVYYDLAIRKSSILYNWRVYDYMPFSGNKLDFMLHAGESKERYLAFFRARRMWQNGLSFQKLREIILKKQSQTYREHRWIKINENGIEYFEPGGYLYTEYIMDEDINMRVEKPTVLPEEPMSEEAEKYLRKILDYCREHDISITLFSSPMTKYRLSSCNGQDHYLKQINAIAKEYGRNYYDFNLCKERYLDLEKEKYWRDWGHLNVWGAKKYTNVFYKIIMASPEEERDKYFYLSYAAQ